MTTGGEEMEIISLPDNAITIGDLIGDQVGVTVTQFWTVDSDTGIAIEAGNDTCVVNSNVTFGDSEDLMADCYEGYAGLTVVVYFDEDFDPDECDACNVDDLALIGGEYEFCAYRFEIPCDTQEVACGEPTASPTDAPTASPTEVASSSPTYSCPENTELVSIDGEFEYDGIPIEVTEQGVDYVKFIVKNTFGQTVSDVFTEYHSGDFGETECVEDENVEPPGTDAPIEFVAQCMHNVKISIVNFWVRDCDEIDEPTFLGDGDNAEIPECCHPPDEECKTVQYTFKLHCIDQCPDDTERKLHQVDAHTLIQEKNEQEKSTKAFEELTGHADGNDAEDHFCVTEDYPCGPDLDKVNVCHYSARDGYKTFCVPEADSDALRFYPKDYCGPCVGGYSTA